MNEVKLNDAEVIPDFKSVTINGVDYYMSKRKPEHYFVKYQGFAVSLSLLRPLDDYDNILIVYLGVHRPKFLTAKVKDFLGGIVYMNGIDEQRVLAEKQMRELDLTCKDSDVPKVIFGK